jgi:AraC-like DNA-binding protein
MLNHMDDPGLSLETASEYFAISARQLRHQLSRNDINFRTLLDQTRHEMAQYLMNQQTDHLQKVSLTDVALACGFSEQSAFNRAFKRWTGLTPGEYLTGS